jgi:hypothetical protein
MENSQVSPERHTRGERIVSGTGHILVAPDPLTLDVNYRTVATARLYRILISIS